MNEENPIYRSEMDRIARLTRKESQQLAGALLALATHGDCPQWVRNGAEAIFADAMAVAARREKRKAR